MATLATLGIALGFCAMLIVFLRYFIKQMNNPG